MTELPRDWSRAAGASHRQLLLPSTSNVRPGQLSPIQVFHKLPIIVGGNFVLEWMHHQICSIFFQNFHCNFISLVPLRTKNNHCYAFQLEKEKRNNTSKNAINAKQWVKDVMANV
jgi:hypothetical protein